MQKIELLKPEEILIGDIITVVDWLSHKDNSYKGDPLEVMAIDLPFVVVRDRRWKEGSFIYGPRELDTRAVTVKLLTEEYVCALLGLKVAAEPDEQPAAHSLMR